MPAVTINLKKLSLSPAQIDNLASEYYGVIGTPAGSGDDKEMIVEFKHGNIVLERGTERMVAITAKSCAEEFVKSLNCFTLPEDSSETS